MKSSNYTFSAKEKDSETGYSYFGARYYDSDLSIWLSVDPMSDEYPSTSPFMYVMGNPIKLIDPNGMWSELVITGEDGDKAFEQLQSKTNLILSRDENGKVSASGDCKTTEDKLLSEIINDNSVVVNIKASNSENESFFGGAFMGNKQVETSTTENIISNNKPFEENQISLSTSKTVADQTVNPSQLAFLDKTFEANNGTSLMHEITESYFGAKISQKWGISAGPAINGSSTYWIYESAHKKATDAPGDGQLYDYLIGAYKLSRNSGK